MERVLYMHTGSGNHGCEAIVRTTAELFEKENTILWSLAKGEDVKYGSANCVSKVVESEEMKRFSIPYFESLFRRKVLKQNDAIMQIFLRELFRNRIAVSIGGDNYCYPWSSKQAVELDKQIRKWSKATVLWGCSIDPEAISPEVKDDLQRFDLITARETMTYQLLKPINPNTVLVSDPAFLLDTKKMPLPKQFQHGNTVGINVSPLIMKYREDGNIVLDNYAELIRYILSDTNMSICLIPHVIWKDNNDLEPISFLAELYKNNDRICTIDDGSAIELKGYISECRYFIGARTHATIAAYSSGVPTLVVGYSTKSRGIARDLFGTENNYVLPVQKLKTKYDLTKSFIWLMNNEAIVKERLDTILPSYKERAKQAVTLVNKLSD